MQHATGYAFEIQDISARWYLFVLATELGGYVLRRPSTKFSKVPGYLRVPEYTLLDTDKYAIEHLDSCLITAVHATNISGSGYGCVRVPESTNTDD